jgi:hypothetical protein
MAAIYTNLAVTEILKEIKDGTGTFPSTWDLACYTVTPALDGTGGTEIPSGTYTWYARRAITFAAPSGRTLANSNTVTVTSNATLALPTPIVSVGILAGSTNNIWIILPLTTPVGVNLTSQVVFPIGQIIQEFSAT